MSAYGFPILVVTTLLVGTAAAIVLTPKDLLRSTVVTAPSPYLSEAAARAPASPIVETEPSIPVIQVASMTVEVTPISAPATALPLTETSPVLAPVAPATPTRDLRRITAGSLNMRSEPNKFSELVASLPRDTEVVVSDTSGSWAYVTTADGTSGWLSQNFLAAVE
jgi:uncharacterized protein YgiM (DUF1202 family)